MNRENVNLLRVAKRATIYALAVTAVFTAFTILFRLIMVPILAETGRQTDLKIAKQAAIQSSTDSTIVATLAAVQRSAASQRAHITWRRNAVVIPLARMDKATSRSFYIPESQPPIYGRVLAYREPEHQPEIYGRSTRPEPPARKSRHGS